MKLEGSGGPDMYIDKMMEVKLGEISENLDNKRIPLSGKERKTRSGNYPYYGAQGIIDYIDDFIFDGTYLLIAEDGENLISKKQNIAQLVNGKFWVNNHAHILLNNSLSDLKFLYYLISNTDISAYISGSAQPKLNQQSLNDIKVKIPLLQRQRIIASILSSLDDKIELNNRINKTLEEMAQAIFKRWFLKFEFPDENGNPHKSVGGEMIRLDQVVDFNPSERINRNQPVRFFDMSCLSNSCMEMGEGITRDTPIGSCFRKYDVLVAKITPCLENGKTGLVLDLDANQVACGSTEFIVMRAKEGVSPFWMYCLARSPEFREKAINSMTGTSGRQRVQVNAIKDYLVSYDKALMEMFDNTVRPMVNMLYNNTCENRRLSKCRDILLPKLLSGSISVF